MKDRPVSCARCADGAVRQLARMWFCAKHSRFQQMRVQARARGKAVPSYEALEAMTTICKGCGVQTHWLVSDGPRTRQATLQHDRSGAMRILCYSCNSRHEKLPGDQFYEVPPGQKRCPTCEAVKPIGAFIRDKSHPSGVKSSCRQCNNAKEVKYVARNKARVYERRRQWRQRRRAVLRNVEPVAFVLRPVVGEVS